MQILLGSEILNFNVIFRKRRTLCIRVSPPGEVTVISPIGKSEKEILETVQAKSKWISKKRAEMKKVGYVNEDKRYVNGEAFYYLGQNYKLRIIVGEKYKRIKVDLQGEFIFIFVSSDEPVKIQFALERWYRNKATEKINERIEYYQQYFRAKPTKVVVKKQRRRWGSCTSKQKLLFNFRCVMLPLPVLDYIVVHEMCHMVQLNHSKDFWKLVGEILPDYKQRKEWLKYNGAMFEV